ncbi:DNA repair protein RAD50 [Smittium mucronatum]|uniref:DNA repair protein RAD50 n=1 Tax=Smittium mucronatum TaxID=133383 RepID=A0A1R0GT04_9FUNG|nr:DNA repair protein RAD50 [Smittium mucronatum]
MSTIEKILIRGIRSFDPNNSSVVEFNSPLTLIVGSNGCGKTTIIECLKYATTGELPPNSKGGAFVYDPKLAGETEVRAQVKLKFRDDKGKSMVCTRSLQVTQKKSTVSFQTLESVLFIPEDRNAGQEIKLQIGSALESIGLRENEISETTETEGEIEKQLLIFEEYIDSFSQLESENRSLSLERDSLNENISEINKHLTEMDEPTSELEKMVKEQDFEKKNWEKATEDYKKALSENVSDLDKLQSNINVKKVYLGKLENQKNSLDQQNKSRNQLILEVISDQKSIANEISISSTDLREIIDNKLNIPESIPTKTFELINNRCDILLVQIRDEKLLSSKKTDSMRQEIQKMELEKASLNKESNMLLEKNLKDESQLVSLKAKLVDVDITKLRMANLKSQLKAEIDSLSNLKDTKNSNDFEYLIKEKKSSLDELEKDILIMSEKVNKSRKNSELIGKSKALKANLNVKKDKYLNLLSEIKSEISVIGKSVEDLDSAQNFAKDYLSQEYHSSESRYSNYLNEASDKKTRLNILKESLSKMKTEYEEKKVLISGICDDSTYESSVQELQFKSNKILEDVGQLKSQALTYKSYITGCKANGKCPLCYRGWDDPLEKDKFISDLQRSYDLTPEMMETAQNQLSKAQKMMDKLKELQPYVERIRELFNFSIPDIESKIKDLELTILNDEVYLNKAKSFKDISLSQLETAKKIMNLINNLMPYKSDLESATKEYDLLLLELNERELDKTNSDLIIYQKSVSNKESSIYKLEGQLSDLKASLYENDKNESLIKDLLSSKENQTLQISLLSNKIISIESIIKSKSNDLNDHLRVSDSNIEEKKLSLSKWEDYYSRFKSINQNISNMESETNLNDKIVSCRNMILILNDDLEEKKVLVEGLRGKISDSEKWFNNFDQRVREISDNVRLRRLNSDLLTLEDRIKSLDSKKLDLINQIHNFISTNKRNNYFPQEKSEKELISCNNAETSRDEYHYNANSKRKMGKSSELHISKKSKDNLEIDLSYLNSYKIKIKSSLTDLYMTKASMVGEKKQIESQVKYLKSELKSNYLNIDSEYLDKMVTYQSLEMTQSDLEKYIKALDNAIMKYHSLKMEEINKIILELWVNTYMADDIDTIEIRSESETQKNNRSYNYRVVMIKGGQAIDMRGRCSAGQKVLASLIIRLALAESFALNCGILALDEPTTNLDKANIQSLAHSLSKIISMRQNRSNFQFVIITHDVEFLDLLGKSDLADYYWEIYKNQEQFSSVKKVPFAE